MQYADYVQGWITPEFGYWNATNGGQVLPTTDDFNESMYAVYVNFNAMNYFNMVGFANVLVSPTNLPDGLTGLNDYFRSVTRNFGLNGFLQRRTPREMLEGYSSPLLETVGATQIVKGGDATVNPFLSINNLQARPSDNQIALNTGQSSYADTRTYQKWLGQANILLNCEEYSTIT